MRNIPLTTGLIIIAFYLLLVFLSWIVIKELIKEKKYYNFYRTLFFSFSFLQSITFIFLFIYPFTTSSTTKYSLYFIYNSILICDLFSRIPMIPGSLLILIPFIKHRIGYSIATGSTILAVSVFTIFLWGFTIGPRTLSKNYIELNFDNLPETFDGLRITQISDLHLGNFRYRKLMERAIESNIRFNPDLLVFTGDLVNNFAYEADKWTEILQKFDAPYKVAVQGNHDYGYYYRWTDDSLKESNYKGILIAYENSGFTLLQNASFKIANEVDSIYLIGVENWGHPPFPQYADLEKASSGVPATAFKIVLSHDPAHWDSVIKYLDNHPLTLSGHSHGLQWGIKLAGIEFSLIYLSRKTWAGIYEYGRNTLYVNRGLGTIGIPFRMDMPAEITFITLRKK